MSEDVRSAATRLLMEMRELANYWSHDKEAILREWADRWEVLVADLSHQITRQQDEIDRLNACCDTNEMLLHADNAREAELRAQLAAALREEP